MSKPIERPPSSTWPSDQVVPDVIGESDEVIAESTDPARVMLARLFGPSIPRTLVVEDITSEATSKTIDVTWEVDL